jgi:hypothetical protein
MIDGFCVFDEITFKGKQKRVVIKQLFFAPVYAMPLRGGNFSLAVPVAVFHFKRYL